MCVIVSNVAGWALLNFPFLSWAYLRSQELVGPIPLLFLVM